MLKMYFKKLVPEAGTPRRGNEHAAGYDLFTLQDAVLQPGETRILQTGIALEIPEGYVGLLRPRSSAFKKGLVIQGTIDEDYRGDVSVVVTNASRVPVVIDPTKAVAQIIFVPYMAVNFEPVSELTKTDRGEGGWGSTGKAI